MGDVSLHRTSFEKRMRLVFDEPPIRQEVIAFLSDDGFTIGLVADQYVT